MRRIGLTQKETNREVGRRGSAAVWVCVAIVLVLTVLAVAAPLGYALGAVIEYAASGAKEEVQAGAGAGGAGGAGGRWGQAARSIGSAAGIAVLATMLAFGPALVVALGRAGRGGSMWARVVAAAALGSIALPTHLSYAGWNVLRRPLTPLGDWIARRPPGFIRGVDESLAIGGLALWAWPLALLALVPALARLDRDHDDALRLSGAGALRRGWEMLVAARGGIAGALALVTLVMLGSAVPLHLAQVDTLAIGVWADLGTMPAEAVWPRAWPALGAAVLGAVVVVRGAAALGNDPRGAAERPEAGRTAKVIALVVIALAVVAPLALFAWGLKSFLTLRTFWLDSGGLVGTALVRSGVVASAALLLLMAMWFLTSVKEGARRRGWRRRVLGAVLYGALAAFAAAALIPGVLIGSAYRLTSDRAPLPFAELFDRDSGLVLAYVARFGVIACVLGIVLARAEPAEMAQARRLAAGDGARGWWRAWAHPRFAVAVGGAIATGALALQEIEATVILAPPGPPALAARLLEHLHYNAEELMMASGLSVGMVSLVLAAVVGVLMRRVVD
ncbi:hypothetical protein BH11PLA1_BH11PLA1_23670 [soil metagenome]